MRRIFFAAFLCIPLFGCAASRPHSGLYVPPPETVALMPFTTVVDGASGEEAADRVGLALMTRGYVVIDRSRTTAIVTEKEFYDAGLSDNVRNAFQAQKIPAVVFGSVNDFSCETKKTGPLFASPKCKKNRCSVSLTAKMVDVASGRLLWGVTLQDSVEGENLTAGELLGSLISRANIGGTLPAKMVESKEAEKSPVPAKVPEKTAAPTK